ncbi:glucose-6-phosphate isomerase [Athalassotoga saccharophila]|nr:glucose-6-phosphate isomerase [Athalassotoga saccharophila]BBJ27566.1 glucose-6-phosphate isomerase [Athalassotoga saccharophila]
MKFDFTNAFGENLSDGVRYEDIKGITGRLHAFLENFRQNPPGFAKVFNDQSHIDSILEMAEKCKHFENFVLVGIGGSALGNQAIQGALRHPMWNNLSREKRNNLPRFFVMDNVDPEQIGSILDVIDPAESLFNVVSKSGSTAETMSNYLIVRGLLETRGLNPRDHLVFTTDPVEGVLRKIAIDEDIPVLDIPPNVGGRFSVLTSVGLLSAASLGVDIKKMLDGAQEELDRFKEEDDTFKNPVLLNAAIHYLYSQKGKSISVMMPYSNALYTLADWYRQLWAESLGKEKSLTGETVHAGQTPIKSLGTIDQHSQVQLYMEGPNDKVITFLKVENFRRNLKIPVIHQDRKELSYLCGHELEELINYEQEATSLALLEHGRPNLTISFESIDEVEIGRFFGYYEILVTAMGHLYNINTFDQPGVELGKKNTYALMNRKGYENQKAHIEDLKKNLKIFKI